MNGYKQNTTQNFSREDEAMSGSFYRKFYILFFSLCLTVSSGSGYADDTEIYFSSVSGAGTGAIRPNVLLILDTSGSMTATVPGDGRSRIAVMKDAMTQILLGMQDVNVGLMRFTFREGGPILFPITYIDHIVADTTFTYSITNGNDDAEEIRTQPGSGPAVGTVLLADPVLNIPQIITFPQIVKQVSAMFDDADQFNGFVSGTEAFWMDPNGGTTDGARFTGIDIPQGADIVSAFLELWPLSAGTNNSTRLSGENVDNSAPFAESNFDISSRPKTAFVQWNNIPSTDPVTSPDIGPIIESIVNRGGWSSGNALSIISHTSTAPSRNFHSYDTDPALAPRLTINVDPDTVDDHPPVDQLVGLRFTDINIPQGATVTSAVLTVTASSSNDTLNGGDPIWRFSAEATDNSPAFAATANNLSARAKTAATVDWAVPAMTQNQAYASPELTTVVQEVINRGGWCGKNDLTIFIDEVANGIRHIHSADGDTTLSPRLTLTYDPATATGCYEAVETAQITGNYDDAEQDGSSMNRTSSDLDIADKRIGLRFREIEIPQGATIVDAFIDFTADGNNSTGNPTVTIRGQAADDPGQFTNTNNNISSRPTTTASVNWTTGNFSHNNVYTTPDLKAIVQEIVNRGGWAPGNAMVFTTTISSPKRTRSAFSRDGNGQKAPRLRITYQASGQKFKSVRDTLIEIVDDLPTSDWTPIVETFYEATRYWRGEGVDYGRSRNGRTQTRISHKDSYTGGTVFYPPGCSEDTLNSTNCINQAITGSPVYISPFSTDLSCQNNYQVLLTDGEANQNEAENKIRTPYLGGLSCQTTKSDGSAVTSGERCGIDLVRFLKENDQSSTLDNDQTVTTYTVGFDLASLPNAVQFLNDLAESGGGEFFEADSVDSLVSAFTEILGEVKSDPTSFVAPSLATNSFNRLLSRDESYFGLFTPSLNIRWPGNVKKYRVCVDSSQGCTLGQILDSSGIPAIDAVTNRFLDSSRSIWTTPPLNDGAQTTQGGAGSKLTDFTDRVIYSDINSPSSGSSLDTIDRKLTSSNWDTAGLADMRTLVCPDPTDITVGSDCEKHMLWLLGKISDPNPTEDVSATTRWAMNDVLHSSPRIITYGGQDNFDSNGDPGTDGIIDTFFDKVIFGTNEGGLRMVNGTTGKEEWTFMPETILDAQRALLLNGEGDHFYGMDVTPATRIVDNNFNGIIEPSNGDKAHVYAAMRRGGTNIYALDVTADGSLSDPTVTPKFLWKIVGGAAPFERLGQSWSQPQLANIATTSGVKPVLIFGGGYDVALDDGFGTAPTGGNDNMGNAIYVVDADTGNKVFSISRAGADINVPDMRYSIPSSVTVFDSDGDGIDDRIYVADTGGQVWRVDLGNDVKMTGGDPEGSSIVGRLAAISNHSTSPAVPADQRRFFEPPSVVQVKDTLFSDAAGGEYDYVLIGSGYRAHPLDLAVHDRFYAFRDLTIGTMNDSDNDNLADGYPKADDTPIGHVVSNELINITTQLLDSSETTHRQALGWFFDFTDSGTTGEKVLSAPVALAGGVFFTTYEPSPDVTLDPCSANIGGGSAYNFNILSTKAFLDWDGDGTVSDFDDRKLTLGGGIPSSVVPIFTKEGVVGIVGIEGGAAQLGTLAGLPRYRTYWYEEN